MNSNAQRIPTTLPLSVPDIEPFALMPRATRFPIEVPVFYRVRGDREWRGATSVNISRTGLLFQTDSDLAPQTMLIACILFPAGVTGESPATVFCWGTVVRRDSFDPLEGRTTVAATIAHYRFSRLRQVAWNEPRAFESSRPEVESLS